MTTLYGLDLSKNQLTSLPQEIARLSRLRSLFVGHNQLASVPPQLGALSRLGSLDLNGNRLRDLPTELTRLESLGALMLAGNRLEALPWAVTQLRNLEAVWLDGNQLTALPTTIGTLGHLKTLRLGGNQLVTLPPAIGRLVNLTTLRLEDNKITDLPPELGNLRNLHLLRLDRNRLTAFPREIAELPFLQELWLDDNMITELPPEIGQLATLRVLALARNRLTAVPDEIADLGRLRELRLNGNQITLLPASLARQLASGMILDLRHNPVSEPLPELIIRGPVALAAYLRGLERAAEQFEAKVLLLGEGDVGKTSLGAALRGEQFVEKRPSTPGIEISSLTLSHPEKPGVEMKLRLWDFGGQEDYRITHQLFISQRALYLVVWYPRQGWAGADVEAWLRGIMLRTGRPVEGGSVRVIIVSTHSDDSRSSVDYPRLERDFPGMLAGHFEIDSRTGAGLEELRMAIAREAAKLPQMGMIIGAGWAAARAEVLELAETRAHISFAAFAEICERNEVPDADVATLAGLMHDLGQIVYYSDDIELRDIVVLNPEWLTRAVSMVLNDVPTREAGGVLDHARLAEIWQDRPGMPSYPQHEHPYFLRLMEKFDVSYRIEEGRSSLIAQLVPPARPDLPWDSRTPLALGTRSLALRCRLAQAAPGLIAWLTVRLHRSSTGMHWRHGVFLRYWIDEYNSEVLIELHGERELTIEVRAPAPDFLFNVVIDSLHYLFALRWPGLEYDLLVPCSSRDAGGTPCPGEFRLEFLRRSRARGRATASCQQCDEDHDVERLLTGFPRPLPLSADLERTLEDIRATVMRTDARMALAANSLRQLLSAAQQEVDDCPRLFTLTSAQRRGAKGVALFERHYQLVLWCEYPGSPHPLTDRAYSVGQPRDWFIRVRPYVSVMLKALQIVIPAATAASTLTLPGAQLDRVRIDIEAMQELVRGTEELHLPPDDAARPDDVADMVRGNRPTGPLTRAEGEALRALRQLIFDHDKARRFAGLRRLLTVTGDYLWLCPNHYAEYDRGLPQLLQELYPRTRALDRDGGGEALGGTWLDDLNPQPGQAEVRYQAVGHPRCRGLDEPEPPVTNHDRDRLRHRRVVHGSVRQLIRGGGPGDVRGHVHVEHEGLLDVAFPVVSADDRGDAEPPDRDGIRHGAELIR